jgi:hypothetical protein
MAKTETIPPPDIKTLPVVTTTTVKIDQRGRLTLSAAILEAGDLKAGSLARILVYEGTVYVVPV